MVDASFGPAGYVETGMAFGDEAKTLLKESYVALDQALIMLQNGTPLQRAGYLLLLSPYLGDPADPSLVTKWRDNPSDCRTEWHDRTIDEIAEILRAVDLYVAWPKRMQSLKPRDVEKLNTEFYTTYRKLLDEGYKKTPAVEKAATLTDYGLTRAWEIVKHREAKPKEKGA